MKPWERPLWYCPKCGKPFVNRNSWHSCTTVPLAEHFRDRPNARRCYLALRAILREWGPVRVVSSRTRVSFMTRVRFAGFQVRKDYLRVGVWLRRRVRSPRIVRTEQYTPWDFGHFFHIRDPADIDEEFRALLRESRAIGDQEHLKSPATASRAESRAAPPGALGATNRGRRRAGRPRGPRRSAPE